jgi:chitinase
MRHSIPLLVPLLVLAFAGCATAPASKPPLATVVRPEPAPSPAATPPPPAKVLPEIGVGGYFASNNIYAKRDYQVADIPASKLTTIYYAFLKIDADSTLTFYDRNADIVKKLPDDPPKLGYHGSFAQLQLLKEQNPKLRVIGSVGGGNMSDMFSPMVATLATRKVFIDSALAFMQKYGFDGLDLDWEFPVTGGQPGVPHDPEDGRRLTKLLGEMRRAFDAASLADGRKYYLGLTVSPNPGYGKYLEIGDLAAIVDFLNIMTYDYHGAWDATSGHLAPLFASPEDPGFKWEATKKMNVAGAVQYYIERGMDPRKLHIGIPLYGIGAQLAVGLKKPLFTAKVPKATIKDTGVMDYASVQRLVAGGTHPNWDEGAHAPYLYQPDTGLFVSYDDGRSVTEKVELVADKGLGGVFFWELSQDRGGDLVNFTVWTIGRLKPR